MAEIAGERERHGDVEAGHGQCCGKIAFEIREPVLPYPVYAGDVVLEVEPPFVLQPMSSRKRVRFAQFARFA